MEKIALVTGSSRGIGRAVAAELARQGWAVCINYRLREDCARSLLEQLTAEGCRAMMVQADVSQQDQVTAMVRQVKETFGPVSLLVNNAGVAGQALLLRQCGRRVPHHPGGAAPHAPPARRLHREHFLHLGSAGRQL